MADLSQIYDLITSGKAKVGVERNIDEAMNPKKYLQPTQLDANRVAAQQIIQSTFGADYSNPYMADFLAARIAEGWEPFEIQQFLQQTPQFAQKQQDVERQRIATEAKVARNELDTSLQAQEEEAFRRAQPEIIASYMRAGRLNSSGLDAALSRARADLQQRRQAQIANIAFEDSARQQGYGREDFVNRQAQAFNQYLRQSEPRFQQRFNIQDASNYAQFRRPYENEDYTRQRNDYFDALARQRKGSREAALYGFAGNLLGTAGQVGMMKYAGAFDRG